MQTIQKLEGVRVFHNSAICGSCNEHIYSIGDPEQKVMCQCGDLKIWGAEEYIARSSVDPYYIDDIELAVGPNHTIVRDIRAAQQCLIHIANHRGRFGKCNRKACIEALRIDELARGHVAEYRLGKQVSSLTNDMWAVNDEIWKLKQRNEKLERINQRLWNRYRHNH